MCTTLTLAAAVCCSLAVTLQQQQPGREQPPTAAPASPASTKQPTPILNAYRDVWRKLDRDKFMLSVYVYPGRATLQFDSSSPPNARQDLTAYLIAIQSQITRLIDLAAQKPEPFPPSPSLDQVRARDAHMDHPKAWFQNFARLLNADAMRCWESGDAAAAITRIIASFRLGQAVESQREEDHRPTGLTMIAQAARLASAQIEDGLLKKAPAKSVSELRTAVAAIKLKPAKDKKDLSTTVNADLRRLQRQLSSR